MSPHSGLTLHNTSLELICIQNRDGREVRTSIESDSSRSSDVNDESHSIRSSYSSSLETCAICLDNIVTRNTSHPQREGYESYELSCKHVFHEQCIRTWARAHSSCPTCRQPTSGDIHLSGLSTQVSSNNRAGSANAFAMEAQAPEDIRLTLVQSFMRSMTANTSQRTWVDFGLQVAILSAITPLLSGSSGFMGGIFLTIEDDSALTPAHAGLSAVLGSIMTASVRSTLFVLNDQTYCRMAHMMVIPFYEALNSLIGESILQHDDVPLTGAMISNGGSSLGYVFLAPFFYCVAKSLVTDFQAS